MVLGDSILIRCEHMVFHKISFQTTKLLFFDYSYHTFHIKIYIISSLSDQIRYRLNMVLMYWDLTQTYQIKYI